MKKPIKKEKVVKKPKEDSKTDVIYVRYLLEDMEAVTELIPSDEKEELKDVALESILVAVKKVHVVPNLFQSCLNRNIRQHVSIKLKR